MSKIALSGNASGTGTFTLASPNSSTDRTLDLPDASGVIDRLNRAGNVLQVVQSTTVATIATSSTTYQASGLIASLTPTSASSKILVSVTGGGAWSNAAGAGLDNKLYRQIASSGYSGVTGQPWDWEYYGGISDVIAPHSFTYLDSPATTSQVFYQPYFRANPSGTGATVRFNVDFYGAGQGVVTLTLMEIAG